MDFLNQNNSIRAIFFFNEHNQLNGALGRQRSSFAQVTRKLEDSLATNNESLQKLDTYLGAAIEGWSQ
ncbi:MAG: hypothetical protein HC896_16085, partial [Bacteroidales bacterium]|nr:hypothetical protein [Bacteroidales bacterium]